MNRGRREAKNALSFYFSEFRIDLLSTKKNSLSRDPKTGSSVELASSRIDRRERRASHVDVGNCVAVVIGKQARGLATGTSAGVGRGFLFLFESRKALAFV